MKILIQNVAVLITMNKGLDIHKNIDILIRPPQIEQIARRIEVPAVDCKVIDGSNLIIAPGMINAHHHFYQTYTRVYPPVQDSTLFTWLINLYEIWKHLDEENLYYSAQLAMMELMKTGCTTTSDHLYIFPEQFNKIPIDCEIKAAKELGIRFIPTHGSMSRSKKDGGLPPDSLVKTEDEILELSEHLIHKYHDPNPFSMLQLALAPCSPFSVTSELMLKSARLARKYDKVLLHTHLCETQDEEDYCLEMYGKRPLDLMDELEWVGDDVWYAHGIYFNDDELNMLARTRTSICHCPTSNMRLGSGICRVQEMRDKGITVGLGVDGSASNDSSDMWGEARNALLLQRIRYGTQRFTAMDAMRLATSNGAKLFHRPELGSIEEGKAADLIGINLDRYDLIGAGYDYPASLLFCASANHNVDLNIINGEVQIQNGKFVNFDENEVVEKIRQNWDNYFMKIAPTL